MKFDKEYETLKQEILLWQEKRFTIVSGSILLVTAALGWIAKDPASWSWEIISIILISFLFCASFLTWFFGISNSRLGAYLEVFYEEGNSVYRWHIRNRKFKDDKKIYRYLNLNSSLALIYIVLGIISIVLPSRMNFDNDSRFIIVLIAVTILFIFSLALLIGFSHPKRHYVNYWRKLKKEELERYTQIE